MIRHNERRPRWADIVRARGPRRVLANKLLATLLLAVTLGPAIALASANFATGDDWSAWNSGTRFVYVSAYLQGRGRGFRDGCVVGEKIYSGGKMHGLPGEQCVARVPTYSQRLENYMAKITEYYQKYPEDRIVPVFKVLEGLSDSRSLTFEQMHSYFPSSIRK